MKKHFIISIIIALMALNSYADIKRLCKVQYETEEGWSKEITIEVQYITGAELNKKTNSYQYSQYSNYCLIWFAQDQVAVLEITTYIVSTGEEFDHEDFVQAFNYTQYLDCKQVNATNKRKWRIKAKDYIDFIDPREKNK